MIANIPYAQRGTKGPLAAAIQAALCEAGHTLDIDGEFGPKTENAPRSDVRDRGGEGRRFAFQAVGRSLGGFSRRTAGKKGANMARKAAQNLTAAQEEAEGPLRW